MFCSEALLLAYTRLPSHAASVDPLIEVCVSVCVFVHRVVFLHHLLCNLIVCAGLSTLLGISILFSHVQRWYVCTVSVCVFVEHSGDITPSQVSLADCLVFTGYPHICYYFHRV